MLRHETGQYPPPYGDYEPIMARGWMPVTFLHYEAGQLGGGAMAALEEIGARGIEIEWSTGGDPPSGLVRIA
jgi:hypothetical protein